MQRAAIILLLLLLGSYHSEAQFWKRWFHKKKHSQQADTQKKDTVASQASQLPTEKKNKFLINYPASKKKSSYRIDIFVQLNLGDISGESSKTKLPERIMSGLDFYEGIKLAADTLNALGYNIDAYVHDISEKSNSPEVLIGSGTLDSADLILAALPSRDLLALANFAQARMINLVSATSASDGGVQNNPLFTMLQPTLPTHCQWLMKYVAKQNKGRKVILIHSAASKADENAYKYLTTDSVRDLRVEKVFCTALPQKTRLAPLLDSNVFNILIVGALDEKSVDTFLRSLYADFPRYRFEVFGMPTWKGLPGLHKPEAYPNVEVNFTSPFHYDLSTPLGQTLKGEYKRDCSGRPSENMFEGYETLYWYAYLLKNYGTIFNRSYTDNKTVPFTKFEVKPKWGKDDELLYNENRHLYLYKYQGGSYMVVDK
jgi:hypothetical protein